MCNEVGEDGISYAIDINQDISASISESRMYKWSLFRWIIWQSQVAPERKASDG